MAKKKAVHEQAKEELAVVLEQDAQQQEASVVSELEYEPAKSELEPEEPKEKTPTYKDYRAAFLPQKKPTVLPKGEVHHNAMKLTWPSDPWGLTKDLKGAFTSLASRIAGDEAKKALVDEVLKVGLGHLQAKFEHDNALRKAAAQADKK
jgi:hypothetical protein